MEKHELKKEKKVLPKWCWIVIIIVIFILIGTYNSDNKSSSTSTSTHQNENKTKVEVEIIDFSNMPRDEIKSWFNEKNMNGNILEEYSDTIEKGNFISQSIAANTIAYVGDKINVVYSLGKKPTIEESNALKKAESYSKTLHMSKKKIYEQLISEYGESFTKSEAQYAIDHLDE